MLLGDRAMLDEEDHVGQAIWTASTGNASRNDWIALGDAQDDWRRMARAAILKMRVLQLA